jgi:DNA polymerase III subunit epsilon
MLYAVTDIETTGGSTRSTKITEIAIYLFDGERIVDEYTQLINPECSIPRFISQLTGITDEMVHGAPKFYEVAKDIVNFTENAVFVAHNVGFDYNVIRQEFKSLGYDYRREHLCTVRSARHTIPGQPSYSLGKLTKALNIQLETHHRAASDALATTHLLQLLININKGDLSHFIEKEINPKELHPLLDLEILDALPKQTGVYRFYNEANQLIYIGKSKSIRTRVLQHLKNNKNKKGAQMRQEIARIEYTLTGSELISLIYESDTIKVHKPIYNRTLRKDKFNLGLYDYLDGKNYIHLTLDSVKNKTAQPITTFATKQDAQRFMEYNFEKYQLCQKLMGLYPTRSACFHYHTKQCKGACIGEESAESYNARVQEMIDRLHFDRDNFFIIETGRNKYEKSLILIKNGSYFGYGYIPINQMNSSLEHWESFIEHHKENKDTRVILQGYLRKYSKVNTRDYL